jgi:hypothetical protein
LRTSQVRDLKAQATETLRCAQRANLAYFAVEGSWNEIIIRFDILSRGGETPVENYDPSYQIT